MFATRTVTARQIADTVAKGQEFTLVAPDGTDAKVASYEVAGREIRVIFETGCSESYGLNERVQVVDWDGTHELWAAEAEAEVAMEARAERFFEEGTEAQQMQYQWEVEQDERNAAFWGGLF